jgi:sigma-E factor negative regulatory protein RseA
MSDRFSDSDTAREALSALADGEAQPHEVARACAAWKDQSDARLTWQAYQVIGDVMRSDDLADAGRSDAFLKGLRERMAQEPVVMAPGAAVAAAAAQPARVAPVVAVAGVQPLRKRAWAGPMAVAAGFVMVVGALMSSQVVPGGAASGDASLAQGGQGGAAWAQSGDLSLALSPAQGGASMVSVADAIRASDIAEPSFSRPERGDGVLMRDPRIDQVMAARHAMQNGNASFASQQGLNQAVVFDAR